MLRPTLLSCLALTACAVPSSFGPDEGVADNQPPAVTVAVTLPASEPPHPAGTVVELTATVTDAEDDPLAVTWTQVGDLSVPVALEGRTLPTARFTVPRSASARTLSFEVAVDDGFDTTYATQQVELTGNRAPESPQAQMVSPAVEATLGQQVTLTAGASDPDGDALAFVWSQAGGATVLSAEGWNAATLTFTLPQAEAGLPFDRTFVFQVRIGDGLADTFVTLELPVSSKSVPFADAGPDQALNLGQQVQLDGSGSYDPDGDPVTLGWTQVAGPTVTLSSTTLADPTFTAPAAEATLVFELSAADDSGADHDQVTILVAALPTALPPADTTVAPSSYVTLQGGGTVPGGGNPARYEWQQVAGPSVELETPGAAETSFVAPADSAVLRFALRVGDADSWSPPATTTVRVNPQPLATAPTNLSLVNGDEVTLVGAGSDPGGEAIVGFRWAIETTPAGSACTATPATCLANATVPVVNFVPDRKGTWLLSLVVTDVSGAESAPAYTEVRVLNRAPAAEAAADLTGPHVRETVSLSATAVDLDGDAIAGWAWRVVDGPPGADYAFVDPSADDPLPATLQDVDFVPGVRARFVLGVSAFDGEVFGPEATVVVTVVNTPPTASAGGPYVVANLSAVDLDGSGSNDPDGDLLGFTWTYLGLAGDTSAAMLQGRFGASAELTPQRRTTVAADAPAACTNATCHTVELIVRELREGGVASDPVTVYVVATNSPPVADAGADLVGGAVGGETTLNGTGAYDPDGDTLASWHWECIAAPGGTSLATAQAAIEDDGVLATPTALFVPPALGLYTFRLTVSDGSLESTNIEQMSVTVDNTAPIAALRMCATNAVCGSGAQRQGLPVGGITTYLFADDGAGGLSVDPDGDPLTYVWTLTYGDGTTATLTGATPTFDSPLTEPEDADAATVSVSLRVQDPDGGRTTATYGPIPFLPAFTDWIIVSADTAAADGWDGDDGDAGCGDFTLGEPPGTAPCATIEHALARAIASGRGVLITAGTYREELYLDETAYGLTLRGGYSRRFLVRDPVANPTVLGPDPSHATADCTTPDADTPFFQTIVIGAPPAGPSTPPIIEGLTLRGASGGHCRVRDGSCEADFATCPLATAVSAYGEYRQIGWNNDSPYSVNTSVSCFGCTMILRDNVLEPGGENATASVGVLVQGTGTSAVTVQGNTIRVAQAKLTAGILVYSGGNVEVSDNVIDSVMLTSGVQRPNLVFAGGTTGSTRFVLQRNRLRMRSDATAGTDGSARLKHCAAVAFDRLTGATFPATIAHNVFDVQTDCDGTEAGAENRALSLLHTEGRGSMIAYNTFRYSKLNPVHTSGAITQQQLNGFDEAYAIQSNVFIGFDQALWGDCGTSSDDNYAAVLINNVFDDVPTLWNDTFGTSGGVTSVAALNGTDADGCSFAGSSGNAVRACTFESSAEPTGQGYFVPAAGSPCLDVATAATSGHKSQGNGSPAADASTFWDATVLTMDAAGNTRLVDLSAPDSGGDGSDPGAYERQDE